MSRPEDLLKRAIRGVGRRVGELVRREPAPSGPPFLSFEGGGAGAVPAGTTVLQAAGGLGVDLDHYCGGTCSCGTCRVEVVEGRNNLSKAEGRERMVLGPVHADRGDRLACQAKVLGPVRVRVPTRY